MPLRPCRECGHTVSTDAATCPRCGAPHPTSVTPNGAPVARAARRAPAPAQVSDNGAAWLRRVLPAVAVVAFFGWCVAANGEHGQPANAAAQASAQRVAEDRAVASAAAPAGVGLPVPSDPRARYFILARAGTAARLAVTTQRIGPSGVTYSRRELDCARRRVRYPGTGDTRDAAERGDGVEPDMAPVVDGSIAYSVWAYACVR